MEADTPGGAEVDHLPPEIFADLVETLFGTIGSFVSGMFGGLIVPAIAWFRTGDWIFFGCTVTILLLAVFRIVVFLAHRSTSVAARRLKAPMWEALYAFGGVGFMTAVGMTAAVLIEQHHDELTALYSVVITLSCAGAVAGRNAGRPAIVIGQVLGLCGPLAVTLFYKQEGWYWGLSFIFLLVISSVTSTTNFLNRMLVSALLSGRESRLQRQRLSTAMNSMSHGLCMIGQDGSIIVINHRLYEFFGMPETRAVATLSQLALDIADAGGLPPPAAAAFAREVQAHVARREPHSFTRSIGSQIYLFRCEPMEDGGSVMVVEDVTEARRSAEEVERLAHFDTLTGLTNRFQFHSILEVELGALSPDGSLVLFTIDLDRFKEVNDTLGHPMGDKLLRQVANRLRQIVGPADIVARFGGDEFQVLVQPDPAGPPLDALATRMVDSISAPYRIDGHAISIGASVGVAVAPRDAREADDLLKCADMALYAAKGTARGTFRYFVPELDAAAQRKRRVEQELRDALAQNELEVHYQPTVDIRTGRITTCEALVRWRHPTLGLIPPDHFIPIAEETGLIAEIGEFVLQRACEDALAWPAEVRVAVNVSAKQFLLRQDLASRVREIVGGSGLPPQRLEIEITESTLLDAKEPLATLSAHGIRISLDDFGTGYSSLSYLRQFPVHKIKIDRGFIKVQDAVSLAIIDAVSFLASALHVDLVVEGVESDRQLTLLIERRVHLIQGYLFSRPRPLADLMPMFDSPFAPRDTGPLRNVA